MIFILGLFLYIVIGCIVYKIIDKWFRYEMDPWTIGGMWIITLPLMILISIILIIYKIISYAFDKTFDFITWIYYKFKK